MGSAQKIGLLFNSVSDNMGDKAIGLVLQRMLAAKRIPFEIVDPFCPDLSNIAMLVIGGGELIRAPGHPFYDAFRVSGPHVLNSVGVLDGAATEYLDEYPIVTVRTEADRARLGRGEVVPCLTLLYSDRYQNHQDISRVPEGAIGIHLTANLRDEALRLARILRGADIGPVVFLPINHHEGDEKIQAAVSAAIPGSWVLPKLSPDELFAAIGRLRLLITCSLHATLFAYACGTRFLTYGAVPKIVAFLGERGLGHHAFKVAAEIETCLLQPAQSVPDHFKAMFERDRERCRKLADRILAAAETALAAPPSKKIFALNAANRVAHEQEMAAVFAAGIHAAGSLEARVELEDRDADLHDLHGEIAYLQTQYNELQTENVHLQILRRALFASNSWRITAPLRQIALGLRSIGIEPRKILPLLNRTPVLETAIAPNEIVRSPEHMTRIGSTAIDTELKLVAFQPFGTDHSLEQCRLFFWDRHAEVAKRAGIYGFCFPYRSGRDASLDHPFWLSVDDSPAAIRFCIWLGSGSLMESPSKVGEDTSHDGQVEDPDTLMQELLTVLQHPRYIRIHNKPLVLMTESLATAQTRSTIRDLRQYCRAKGSLELFLVATKSSGGDLIAPEGCDPDALLELVRPEAREGEERPQFHGQRTSHDGQIHDYRRLIERSYETRQLPRKIFRSAVVDLDTGQAAHDVLFQHASPAGYQEWLENICIQTERLFDREERLIFVQGWNSAGAEEPFGWDRRYGYGYLNATAQALKSTAARREMSPLKVAVTVHAYYPELWPEISDLLKPWDSAFGLYVTVPAHADASFAEAIRAEWPQAIVAPVENRGRDMAPFLAMAARAIDDGHSLICKVHTKKSPHLGRGHFWRRDMLRKLLGTVSVEQIQHSFRQNAALGIIAPQGHVLSGTHQFRLNKRHLTELLKKLGHDEDPLPFVFSAGSMFWIRADAMRPLLNLQLRPTDFEAERGQLDGTLAHALERLFPLAARLQGYRTADTRVVGKTFGPSNLRSELELAVYELSSGAYW